MTREIKFRAWDKKNKNFIDVDEYYFFDCGQLKIRYRYSLRENDFHLMQFTGLKDKNGKDIYEGYIIKWDAEEWGSKFTEVVEWDYGLFDMRQNDWSKFCEIIGNIYEEHKIIYENPELLGGSNDK